VDQLWLVCDVSGSMAESGKRLVVRGVVRQVEQYFRFGYANPVDLRLATWGTEVKVYNWQTDDEVPVELFDCYGSSSSDALFSYIKQQPEAKFLVLTDGGWSSECERSIRLEGKSVGGDIVRFVKIGYDGNSALRGQKMADVDGLLVLLDGWFKE
jgi:hypothetical protein